MSRIALLADVHGNLVALEAVLEAAGSVDAIWVMGDTVGYGPDPSDVLALLRGRGARIVAGNHDLAVGTGQGLDAFNPVAAAAARIHRTWLGAEERDALAALPLTLEVDGSTDQGPRFTLCHGSLRDPVWEYVLTGRQALATLEISPTPHCCNGHTHVQALFRMEGERRAALPGGASPPVIERSEAARPGRGEERGRVERVGQARLLVNPGSVGQPRDRDPRAAYAILETGGGTITFARAAYDVAETQRRIRSRGLPELLADRLAIGW